MSDGTVRIRTRMELPKEVWEYLERRRKREYRQFGEVAAEELVVCFKEKRLKGEL